ncbi:hypothetical protein RDWZM_002075 [Blomia tropicalis]|uniref:C2H2-type domain-containing protein n=1 Tax=Blomia tropicalis TaxID=40697 RepID=A0A9Q0MCT6_BLOTA|nr:hypothetical protein RDWZM_002075 [Blomia tropicalis]
MSDRNEANIPIKKRSVKGITQFKNYEADTRKLQNKFDAIADENPTTSHGTPILDDEVKDKYSDVSCKLKRKVQTNDCYESNETCSSFENDNSPIHHSQTGSNDMQENILHSSPTANAKSNETVAGKKILKRNNDKKFNCDFCQLSFDQQDDLNNHLLIHQNEVEVVSRNIKN